MSLEIWVKEGAKMKISSDIKEVIDFLQTMETKGYKTVEVINKSRSFGWRNINPTIEFIFNEQEPTVLGINAKE